MVHHDRRLRRRLRRKRMARHQRSSATATGCSARTSSTTVATRFVNTWNFLDMTALGRQETWEDSPEGYPQTKPYEWWNWHDEYGEHEPSRWFGEPDPNDPNDRRPPREPEG